MVSLIFNVVTWNCVFFLREACEHFFFLVVYKFSVTTWSQIFYWLIFPSWQGLWSEWKCCIFFFFFLQMYPLVWQFCWPQSFHWYFDSFVGHSLSIGILTVLLATVFPLVFWQFCWPQSVHWYFDSFVGHSLSIGIFTVKHTEIQFTF